MESPRWNAFGIVYAAIIAFTVVLLVLSIPFGIYAVFFTHLSTTYTYQNLIAYFPIYIGLVEFGLPLRPSFGVLFLSLTALYAVFIVVAGLQAGGLRRAVNGAIEEGPGALLRNPLSATTMILGATLLATVVLDLFQTSVGVQTGGLSGDSFLLFLDLTISPLIEEVGFRFFLIGVPLFVLLLATRPSARKLVKTLWRPSAAWEVEALPGAGQIRVPSDALKNFAIFLVAVSSILFGLAHYLSGAGWDIGKVSEAALDGVALGYLYVRYGLHASIIFHWAVDYATNAFAFYGQGVYGVPWTANSLYSLVPTVDVLLLVGLPGLLFFINLALKRVIRPRPDSSTHSANASSLRCASCGAPTAPGETFCHNCGRQLP
ncbi:MAG: zinc ribbon domain-containing protein [Thaumarchaeota archaeon]|nr:zinc ribbon domain-containing protein [Nitrososphaerota archaeon]